MLKLSIQYFVMAASLCVMYFVLAFFRSSDNPEFISHLALLLMLIAWSTPLEAVIANTIFKFERDKKYLKFASDRDLLLRLFLHIFIFSIAFALLFSYSSRKTITTNFPLIISVGLLIGLRLAEGTLRVLSLSRNKGQSALLLVNTFSTFKWALAFAIFIFGFQEFLEFTAIHVLISAMSVCLLLRLSEVSWAKTENIAKTKRVHEWRADLSSYLGIFFGVFAYQIDKILANLTGDRLEFGQYVLLCTLAFVGPYLLAPLFSMFQQNFFRSNLQQPGGHELNASQLRLGAILATIATIPALVILQIFVKSENPTYQDNQFFMIIVASYLNCLSHISFLRYQAIGRSDLIMKQNLTSFLISLISAFAIVYFSLHSPAIALVAAALGQYLYGIVRDHNGVMRPPATGDVLPLFISALILATSYPLQTLKVSISDYPLETSFLLGATFLVVFLVEMRSLNLPPRVLLMLLRDNLARGDS